MRYRLKLDEPLADGVRRIGIGQIERAVGMLASEDRDTGIHEARKCFKRMRALLDMIRPVLKPKVYKRENRRFRDLGRALSGARDVHVMRQTLDKLAEQRDLGAAGEVPSALRVWLDAKRARIVPIDGDAAMRQAQRVLAEAREAFADLPVKGDSFAPLAAGVRTVYAGGRKIMNQAYRRGDDEIFHEWRKHVQRHWRQLQLVRNAWPEAITPRIALASDLSDLIGEDHDLSVLIEFVRQNRAILGARDAVDALIEAAQARQADLRNAAFVRGRRLYALPPRALEEALMAYWETAPEVVKAQADIEPLAQGGKVVNIAR
ncbi:CHAD domain-containing protein [Dichotomicrobium thermohalophilum]|uniref:CHAD domain-containing protein n=2 Tax=Dichotomicrobium thermohalophilum TaxID=933063 RepID=A0A397PCS8_9HYPH|nr:CHAD domain-containing protein [Dichotomicrobium thermohalophilum]